MASTNSASLKSGGERNHEENSLGNNASIFGAERQHHHCPKKTVKQVHVTAEIVASRPEGQAYVIDVTRDGTVYTIDADVDLSRMQIRTSKGLLPMNEMVKRSGRSGKLLIGHPRDIRFQELEMIPVRGRWMFQCTDSTCYCHTLDDCEKLSESEKCKGSWTCDKKGCTCDRKAS